MVYDIVVFSFFVGLGYIILKRHNQFRINGKTFTIPEAEACEKGIHGFNDITVEGKMSQLKLFGNRGVTFIVGLNEYVCTDCILDSVLNFKIRE